MRLLPDKTRTTQAFHKDEPPTLDQKAQIDPAQPHQTIGIQVNPTVDPRGALRDRLSRTGDMQCRVISLQRPGCCCRSNRDKP
jgi:hypothetical protein